MVSCYNVYRNKDKGNNKGGIQKWQEQYLIHQTVKG